MAAGMGTRIATKTNEPKCLLDIGNGPLIRHTVELLLNNHMEVCICLGFKGYLIREALRDYPITFYENPFYRVTNSIASLWFSREQLDETQDLLLANADVFWQQDILDLLLADQRGIVLLADRICRRLSVPVSMSALPGYRSRRSPAFANSWSCSSMKVIVSFGGRIHCIP